MTEREMQERFPGCVVIVMAFAEESGPRIDVFTHTAWLAATDVSMRTALLQAIIQGSFEYGKTILPEGYAEGRRSVDRTLDAPESENPQ